MRANLKVLQSERGGSSVPLEPYAGEPEPVRSLGWWWLPGVWFVAVVLPYPLWSESVQGAVYLATGSGTVVALLVGVRTFRPAAPAPWCLLSAAFGFFFLGDLLTYVHLDADGMPMGPWSDLSYLAFYPLALGALVLLMRRGADRDVSAWLDAVIWTVGASVLSWEWTFEDSALVDDPSVASMVTVAYPAMDLVLLLVLLRLVFASVRGNRALLLLVIGLGVQLVTDVVYLSSIAGAGYDSGRLLDLGWLFTYTAVAAAALHPSMAESGSVHGRHSEPRLSSWRIPLLLVPALTAPTMIAAVTISGSLSVETEDVAVATAATFLVILLASARGSGLVRLANRRADDLKVRIDHDTLTGCGSRDRFTEHLGNAVDGSTKNPDQWSVIFLDLDDFKMVNDIQGHLAGDQLLVEVGRRLRAAAPDHGVVARFGGDEFALLVHSIEVEPTVKRILAAIETPVLVHGREVRARVSIGSAVATPGLSADELMRCVDIAMYDAKRSAYSWARYDPQMSQHLLTARNTQERLANGIAEGEVAPWYQPVVDLETGALTGFEALARWVAGDGVDVTSADQWLPLAEQSDLIIAVDRHVMRAAIQQLARWRGLFDADDLTMAINVSGRTLHQPGIEDEILEHLRQAGVPCHRLVVEVTEGVQIQDDEVGTRLQRLRAHGVRVALDDFGTGWSSLSYLRRFPVDILKLDRSFTNELGSGVGGTAIPAAVRQLAAALGLEVVAEGVETQPQRAALLHLGFTLCQGYLYSAAVPGADLDQCVLRAAQNHSKAHHLGADDLGLTTLSTP